jgi:Cytochrome c
MGERMTSTRKWIAVFIATCLLGIAGLLTAQQQGNKPVNGAPKPGGKAGATASAGSVARGKYLVEDVAYCTNCHTPRNSKGELLRDKWLQGGPLFWQPARPLQNFPQLVPRIAGTPPATDDEMVTLLTTGVWKDGTRLREPMPQFRFTKDDAQAVIAYLKTLNPVKE